MTGSKLFDSKIASPVPQTRTGRGLEKITLNRYPTGMIEYCAFEGNMICRKSRRLNRQPSFFSGPARAKSRDSRDHPIRGGLSVCGRFL